MSWLRLDAGFPNHPKVALLPLKARWLLVEAGCWCARYLTDGAIPRNLAPGWEGGAAVRAVVEAGLWHEGHGCGTDTCIKGDGTGYVIHDFLVYNPSREQIAHRSDANRSNARKRTARDSLSESPSDSLANGSRGRVGVGVDRGKRNKEHPRFAEFYDAYPRHVGRRAAAKKFDEAIHRVDPDYIIAAARAVRADPNLPADASKIPHPSTWLNRDGWLDDPYPPPAPNGTVSEDSSTRLRRLGIVQEETG